MFHSKLFSISFQNQNESKNLPEEEISYPRPPKSQRSPLESVHELGAPRPPGVVVVDPVPRVP